MPATVPMVNFSVLGALPQTYRSAQLSKMRDTALKNAIGPGGTIDYGRVLGGLAQAGDIEGLLQVGRLKSASDERTANREWRQAESARSQRNADRSYALQAQQANRPDIKSVTDPATGQTSLVLVDRSGRTATPLQGGPGAPGTPSPTAVGTSAPAPTKAPTRNPYAPAGKPLTESQSKAFTYATRLHNAERILQNSEIVGAATDPAQAMRGNVPLIGNYLVNPEYQQYDQAARDFINATLRRESGAAISQSEFNNAYRQYLPRPGDGPEVLAQKRRNRMFAIRGIAAGAGAGFIPPYTFDRQGNIVDYNQPSGRREQGPAPGVGGVGTVSAAPGGKKTSTGVNWRME